MENPPDDATPTPAPAQATDGYTSLVADALAELGLGSDALPPWHFDPTNPPLHVRERVRRLLGTAAYCIPTASVNDGGTATGIVGGVFAIESQRRSHLNGARNAEANAQYASCGAKPPSKAAVMDRVAKRLTEALAPRVSYNVAYFDSVVKALSKTSSSTAARQRYGDMKKQLTKLRADLPRAALAQMTAEFTQNRTEVLDYIFGEDGGRILDAAIASTLMAFITPAMRSQRSSDRFMPFFCQLGSPGDEKCSPMPADGFIMLDIIGGVDAVLIEAAIAELSLTVMQLTESVTLGFDFRHVDEVVLGWLARMLDRKSLFLPAFESGALLFARMPPHLRDHFVEHHAQTFSYVDELVVDLHQDVFERRGATASSAKEASSGPPAIG